MLTACRFFSSALCSQGFPVRSTERHQSNDSSFIAGTVDRSVAIANSDSLVAQETNVRLGRTRLACATSDLESDPGIVFRHSGWAHNRMKIRKALERSKVAEARLEAWDGCGMRAWVLRSMDDGETLRIAGATCKDRFCVPCADTRSARIGNRIREKVPPAGISFLTLTMADNDQGLAGLLDKLIRSFRQLRRWKRWKQAVAGGVSFIEVKWSERKQRWHPHVHAIIEATYIEQAAIADEWRRITGTSFIVHIKRPPNSETVIRYVTKYGSKPLDQTFVDNADRLDEAIRALKGRRLAMAFGSWRGWALLQDDDDGEWQAIDTLESLMSRERRGDPDAVKIMEQLRCQTRQPLVNDQGERAPPILKAWELEATTRARRSAHDAVNVLRISLGLQSVA